jgi:hypothetical protein
MLGWREVGRTQATARGRDRRREDSRGIPADICDLEEAPEGLHTLYVSPLKALAVDVQRNLLAPIEEMGLDPVETRPATRRRTARRGSA